MLEIEGKYFTTFDCNKFTSETLNAKIKQKALVSKSDVYNLLKNSDLSTKIVTLAAKSELKAEQDKFVKLEEFDSS